MVSQSSSSQSQSSSSSNSNLLLLSSTATIKPTEFGGVFGTLCTTIFLPIVIILLLYWSDIGQFDIQPILNLVNVEYWKINIFHNVTIQSILWSCLSILCWYLFTIVLERILPYDLIDGSFIKSYYISTNDLQLVQQQQSNNSNDNSHDNKIINNIKEKKDIQEEPTYKLQYRMNGHLTFWVTLFIIQFCYPISIYNNNNINDENTNTTNNNYTMIQFGSFPLHKLLYNNYMSLAIASILLSYIFSFYFYISSFTLDPITKKPKVLANVTNYFIYDYFMGRELNPRSNPTKFLSSSSSSIDWKEFCELRPGLLLWMLLNISCIQEQYNTIGYITGSMILINIFQGFYVWDALYQEKSIVTTMDITTDGFGFMLLFGDLTWVPFTYSIQAKYLTKYDPHLSFKSLILITFIHCLGYYIFRNANSEKDIFRKNPNSSKVKHLKFIQTKRGTKLLISGWWGIARKINYTGDYLIGLSWCLLCGFNSIIPYFYAIYFAILLITRANRDDEMCYMKYGTNDWNLYKQHVPYRFLPGIW